MYVCHITLTCTRCSLDGSRCSGVFFGSGYIICSLFTLDLRPFVMSSKLSYLDMMHLIAVMRKWMCCWCIAVNFPWDFRWCRVNTSTIIATWWRRIKIWVYAGNAPQIPLYPLFHTWRMGRRWRVRADHYPKRGRLYLWVPFLICARKFTRYEVRVKDNNQKHGKILEILLKTTSLAGLGIDGTNSSTRGPITNMVTTVCNT